MPLVSLVCVSFFLCADTTWWLSWDPYAPPFSPADEATTSRKQLDPLPSQLSHKKEKRKKKEGKKNTQRRDSHTGTSVIHQHDQDFRTLDLSAKLHQMTKDNSSWFGNLLGKPWLWIKEIAILLLFLLLAYYLCIHSIKCFFQQMTSASHEEMTSSNQKRLLPVRTSRTLIACFCFCVRMQLHISNTEHVQCACNDYKLQELTFKCLNLYFVRVIRTLKGGIVGLQIVFKCLI